MQKKTIIPFLSKLYIEKSKFKIGILFLKSREYDFEDMSTLPVFNERGQRYTIRFFAQDHVLLISFMSKKQYFLWKEKFIDAISHSNFFIRMKVNLEVARNLFKEKVVDEFLRDSSITELNAKITLIMESFNRDNPIWGMIATEEELTWLNEHHDHFPLNEDHISYLREWHIKRNLKNKKNFFDIAESNPLTENQRLACIRNNDRNMVLAAAGTGKTSVVIAKALDLIINKNVDPKKILILAYNKKAADELNERFITRSQQFDFSNKSNPTISTFHAMGLRIIRNSGVASTLSKFSEDDFILEQWISEWLLHFLSGSEENLQKFLETLYRPYDPFDFESNIEYERYHRDNEFRSLNKIKVRGFQEVLIANWLFINNIQFEYEPNYVKMHKIDEWHSYRPDFKIYDKEGNFIYLEHFGISRDKKTRPDIDSQKYVDSMEAKRKLHRDTGTVLIETYHYDWKEKKLLTRLEEQLREHHIYPKPLEPKQLITVLEKSDLLPGSVNRLMLALKAIRVGMLSNDEILNRLEEHNIANAKTHAYLLTSLHSDYIRFMRAEGTIDFDDMILLATQFIEDGSFIPKWQHILIDEFQDISESRMNLVNQLVAHGDNPVLTVVGDDWQSIYRFAGGKLELTTRFKEYFGNFTQTILNKTFRYNNSIADTAGKFIMQNPEQYRKDIETHTRVEEPHVVLVDDEPLKSSRLKDTKLFPDDIKDNSMRLVEKTLQIALAIRQYDPQASIAILSRYNFHLVNIKSFQKTHKITLDNAYYWTIHKSKGLEADYCIIMGISQGRLGFPSDNTDHEIIEALLPSLDTYKYSEERRLFYVALTRGKKKIILVSNARARSSFVNELLSPSYDISIKSKRFDSIYQKVFKCPKCTDGAFMAYMGSYGAFYSCTTGSGCGLTARSCPNCKSPYVVKGNLRICQNDNCGTNEKLCPKCGRPLRQRKGRFGDFWGCSGYGIKEDQCTYTENIY